MLRPRFTNAFKKDRRRARRRGQDVNRLDDVMRRLANEERLDPRFRDHRLAGSWSDFRECHIAPDWVLIYAIADEEITFVRTGTHSDLFME